MFNNTTTTINNTQEPHEIEGYRVRGMEICGEDKG